MDVETRIDRLADQVAAMQQQLNTVYVSPGATAAEVARIKALEETVKAKDVELATLQLSVADLSKRLAALPDEKAVTRKTNNAIRTTVDAVGDVLAVTADKLREETAETVRDASVNLRKMADRAQAASEANVISATAFIRRSLHNFCS